MFVVEDQLILAIGMQSVLEDAGMRVAITASPEETRARIERELPAVAVVDLNLRGELDGIKVAEELSARGVKVIVCSAYDHGSIEGMPELAAYLRKPVAPEALIAAVRGALS